MANKESVSKLIAKGDCFAVCENGKYITVSTYDSRKRNGYSNKYIPNTPQNRGAIMRKMGKPEVDEKGYRGRKRFLWF